MVCRTCHTALRRRGWRGTTPRGLLAQAWLHRGVWPDPGCFCRAGREQPGPGATAEVGEVSVLGHEGVFPCGTRSVGFRLLSPRSPAASPRHRDGLAWEEARIIFPL